MLYVEQSYRLPIPFNGEYYLPGNSDTMFLIRTHIQCMANMEGLVKGKPIVKFFVMMGVIMSD